MLGSQDDAGSPRPLTKMTIWAFEGEIWSPGKKV